MKKNIWLYLFIAALLVNLSGIILSNESLHAFSKPVIVISLIGYFIAGTIGLQTGLQVWIILALIFSLAGDVLLLFESNASIFFLLGLSAFLIAHIFYIIFFHKVRIREAIAGRWWLLLIVAGYYIFLITLLGNSPGDMKLPVRVYGVIISFMLMLALHMYFQKNKKAGWLMITGATLFVVSDSVLAIDKFYAPFEQAGFIIMLTYGLAQLFLVRGATEYITSVSKR